MIRIIKRPSRLSDGSIVYDVIIREDSHGEVVLHAIGEAHADHLVEALRAAIVNYSVDEPHTSELVLS